MCVRAFAFTEGGLHQWSCCCFLFGWFLYNLKLFQYQILSNMSLMHVISFLHGTTNHWSWYVAVFCFCFVRYNLKECEQDLTELNAASQKESCRSNLSLLRGHLTCILSPQVCFGLFLLDFKFYEMLMGTERARRQREAVLTWAGFGFRRHDVNTVCLLYV